MSDPVTRIAIEDVLASIRRLVSDETRVRPTPGVQEAPEKLVLTPAQRVVQDGDLNRADPAADATAGPMLLTGAQVVKQKADTPVEDGDDTAPEPQERGLLNMALLDMAESELSTALASRSRVRVAGQSLSETHHGAPSEFDRDVDADPPTQESVEPLRNTVTHRHERPRASSSKTLEQKIAELESMIAEGAPPPSPPVETGDAQGEAQARPSAGETPAADEDADEDAAFAEDVEVPELSNVVTRGAFPGERHGQARAPHPPLDLDDAAPLIDEEMLRDLVADIVRQELQGVLGERITRNVRKLVRREIQRALMAQSFE